MKTQRAGGSTVYIVLGILAGLLLLTFISMYLFGSWKSRAHTNHPQSSRLIHPVRASRG
jgi:hypothetical protein